jgi:hypothetical protein
MGPGENIRNSNIKKGATAGKVVAPEVTGQQPVYEAVEITGSSVDRLLS